MAKKKKRRLRFSPRTYRRIGSALPRSAIRFFDGRLKVAGIRKDAKLWLGVRVLLAFLTGSILLLLYLVLYDPIATVESGTIAVLLVSAGFLIVLPLSYLHLYFKVSDRTQAVEKVLPDFLLLTVSNLRAGLSPFASFINAARPEFGALHEEIRISTAKYSGTASLVDALSDVAGNFDSEILRRSVSMFGKGINSGGQIAKLLNSSAREVRRIQDLRAELASSTRTYGIFLGFIIIIIMPFLLSVSTQFVSIFLAIQESSEGMGEGMPQGMSAFSGYISVTPGEMMAMSVSILVLTSLLVSCLIGIISRGRPLYGVKYFPILAVLSLIFLLLTRELISSLLYSFGGPI